MEKKKLLGILWPTLMVIFGGLFMIALVYGIYLGVYLGIEALFYEDVTQTPTDTLRAATGFVLCLIWVLLAFTKMREVLKVTLGVGPLTMMMVVIFFRLYTVPLWGVVAIAVLAALCSFFVFLLKKPWFYYLAIGLSFTVSILYAWPR